MIGGPPEWLADEGLRGERREEGDGIDDDRDGVCGECSDEEVLVGLMSLIVPCCDVRWCKNGRYCLSIFWLGNGSMCANFLYSS